MGGSQSCDGCYAWSSHCLSCAWQGEGSLGSRVRIKKSGSQNTSLHLNANQKQFFQPAFQFKGEEECNLCGTYELKDHMQNCRNASWGGESWNAGGDIQQVRTGTTAVLKVCCRRVSGMSCGGLRGGQPNLVDLNDPGTVNNNNNCK